MVIKEVIWTQKFEDEFKKVKDTAIKERIKKQIEKIIKNPDVGKPLRFELKGERAVYIKSYRLIYSAIGDKLYLLRFEHRKKVYRI
ncbi:MAG: type II toxin-antitoxin system RelE/ParE family toxin [Candidatus Aenigmatarchaeota archaeon]